jgi:hypothetical protein
VEKRIGFSVAETKECMQEKKSLALLLTCWAKCIVFWWTQFINVHIKGSCMSIHLRFVHVEGK